MWVLLLHPVPSTTMTRSPYAYGPHRSPQPMRGHTCKIRRRLERGFPATSQDDCPGCRIEREEGWHELLASFRQELMGDGPHRE